MKWEEKREKREGTEWVNRVHESGEGERGKGRGEERKRDKEE